MDSEFCVAHEGLLGWLMPVTRGSATLRTLVVRFKQSRAPRGRHKAMRGHHGIPRKHEVQKAELNMMIKPKVTIKRFMIFSYLVLTIFLRCLVVPSERRR